MTAIREVIASPFFLFYNHTMTNKTISFEELVERINRHMADIPVGSINRFHASILNQHRIDPHSLLSVSVVRTQGILSQDFRVIDDIAPMMDMVKIMLDNAVIEAKNNHWLRVLIIIKLVSNANDLGVSLVIERPFWTNDVYPIDTILEYNEL